MINGPAIDNVPQHIVNEPNQQAQGSPNLKGMDHASARFDVDLSKPKPSHKAFVKGKKVLARLWSSHAKSVSAVGEATIDTFQLAITFHEQTAHDENANRINDNGQQSGIFPQFQFTTRKQSEVGHHFQGNGGQDTEDWARRN